MTDVTIVPTIRDGEFAHLKSEDVQAGRLELIGGLPDGMASGNPSVAMLVRMNDGRYVFAETSLVLFLSAADAMRAAHGDPRATPEGGAQ